jgi:phage terminase large subunit
MDSELRMTDMIGPAFYGIHNDIKRQGHTQYWLPGGRGSLKSSFASIEIPLGMIKDPLANAIVYRKVADTLRLSVYEQMIWGIEKLGVGEYFHYGLSPLVITYKPTGQKILFRGCDEPKKSKSIKLRKGYFKYLWFEEAPEFSGIEEIRSIAQSIGRGTPWLCQLITYNPPKTRDSWVNLEALEPHPGRLVHLTNYLQAPPEWLDKAFIEEAEALKAINRMAYRHEYLGEVTGTGGQVFDNLEVRPITPEERERFDRHYNGLDFGFAVDPAAMLRMHYQKPTRTLYILNEIYGQHLSNRELAERVIKLCGREIVTCDSEDPRTISELAALGVNAVGAKKGPDSVRHGMRWLESLAKIVIDRDQCPNAAREFECYEFEQDRHGNFIARYPDKNNHTIDATRYGMEPISTQQLAKTTSKEGLGL